MKINILIIIILILSNELIHAQQTNRGYKELEQMNIGWTHMMSPNGNAVGKNTVIQGRTYTAYQIGLIDTFTNWIKKSYVPVGGLAQPGRYTIPDCKTKCPHIPYGTGISMQLWAPCYDNSGVKIIKAQPASHKDIHIYANNLPGMEPAVDWFNTDKQYLFTLYYKPDMTLLLNEDNVAMQPKIKEISKNLNLDDNYFIYYTGGGWQVNVVLTPLQKIPLVQLTKGEVLEEGLKALERAKTANKLTDNQYQRYTEGIETLKKKHAKTLSEPAFIKNPQLSIYDFDSTTADLFEKEMDNRYMFPVYKFDETAIADSKKDKPLWITISFPYGNNENSYTHTVDREMFNAMLYNFNYQYVYDYFFNLEKVKGKNYEIRNPEILEKNSSKYQKSK